MKVLTLTLCLITFVYCKEVKTVKSKCDGVHVREKFHRKEILSNGINRPYQLSVYDNRVFFSYNVGDDNKDLFEIGYIKKENEEAKPLNHTIENGFATAVDVKNKIVYFGGSNGIHIYNISNPDKVEQVSDLYNIWDMFFLHHLYFIVYPTQRLYVMDGKECKLVEHIHEKIYQFAIDNENDTFFVTKKGLQVIENGTKNEITYEGPSVFRAIELDRNGVAYFCGLHGIYIADKKEHKLKEIAHIMNIFGLTFDDNNNIIYSDPHQIVKLLPEDCK